MKVRHAVLPASDIFNACDPSLLWNVAKDYGEAWWDSEYDELRAILFDLFVTEFDKMTGHYTRLRESIKSDGIKDPIIVTAGAPLWRESWMVPRNVKTYICESCGGSRLLIASELGIDVPCIINDRIGVDGEVLNSAADVIARFTEKSYQVTYGPPCRVLPVRFSHMDNDYTMREQQQCRRKVKEMMIQAAQNWKKENTRKCGL